MPDVARIIVNLAAIAVGGPWGAVIAVTGNAAISSYEQRKARAAYRAAMQDRNITLRSASQARRYALGRVRMGGVLNYADTDGYQNKIFDQMLLLCDGPIKGVVDVYFDDEPTAVSSFVGDRPGTGKFAATEQPKFRSQSVSVTNTDTFTLASAPTGVDDVTVTLLSGAPGEPPVTLAVQSVSGTTVTLVDPVVGTKTLYVDYLTADGNALMRVQFLPGTLDQAFQNWGDTGPGVPTPRFSGDMRYFGIATLRTLMYWNKTLYANGPPVPTAVVDGILAYDHRRNRCPNPGLEGGVGGDPGTLPTSHGRSANANGITSRVLGFGMSGGLPYMDIRLEGTATGGAVFAIRLPDVSAAPAAVAGQTWNTRCHVQRRAGSLAGFAAARLWVVTYDAADAVTLLSSSVLDDADTGPTLDLRACAHTAGGVAPSGAVKAGAQIRLQYTTSQVVALTLRVALPQLWQLTDPVRWTSNPSVLGSWFSLLPRAEGGLGRPWDYLDWDWVVDSANICDELISVRQLDGTGYEDVKRYECHTVLTLDVPPLENFNTILSTMDGSCAFTAGRYRIAAGAYRPPTLTLTDADVCLDEPITVDPAVSGLDVLPNQVTATLVDKAKNYVSTAAPQVVNDVYVTADGVDEPISIELDGSTDARQANYLMGILLERQRGTRVASLTVLGVGANIALLQTVQLDLVGYEHLAGVVWEVRRRSNRFNGRYSLQLHEVRPSTWALDADRFTPIEQPEIADLSYLWQVTQPQDFLAEDQPATLLPDGTTAIRIVCTWTLHPQPYVRETGQIEIRYKRVDQVGWTGHPPVDGSETRTVITVNAKDGMRYRVEARAVNGLGAPSGWSPDYVDIGATDSLGSIQAKLSADSTTLPATSAGVVTSYAGASTTLTVERNNVAETGAWTITRTNGPGVTSSIAGATVTLTALDAGTDSSYVDITATRSGYPTQTKRWALSKAKSAAVAAGVVNALTVVSNSLAISPADALAGVRLNRDGTIDRRSFLSGGGWVSTGLRWNLTVGATVGDGYYARATKTSGTDPTGAALGTALQLNSARAWELPNTDDSASEVDSVLRVQISPNANMSDVEGVLTLELSASVDV